MKILSGNLWLWLRHTRPGASMDVVQGMYSLILHSYAAVSAQAEKTHCDNGLSNSLCYRVPE